MAPQPPRRALVAQTCSRAPAHRRSHTQRSVAPSRGVARPAGAQALAYAYNTEFSRVLHQQMEYFSTNPSADAITRVKGEISEVKSVMVENIDKAGCRGPRPSALGSDLGACGEPHGVKMLRSHRS